jgi:CheY-like chemotaxis protein
MAIKILVVDDNPDALSVYSKAISRQVKHEGWNLWTKSGNVKTPPEVLMADSVPNAIKLLQENNIDILVVDMKMRGFSDSEMGGYEVINKSQEIDPLCPIIIITAYGSTQLVKETFCRGIFDFIEKSFNAVNEMIDAIQRALRLIDERLRQYRNPFAGMSNIDPSFFGGRIKEIEFFDQKLVRALLKGQYEHFLIQGDWGIGKSTLLKEYKKICHMKGYLATIVPLAPLTTESNLLFAIESIVEGIIRELPFPISKFKSLYEYFNSVGITILGTGLQFDKAKKNISPQSFLHDALLSLWSDIKSKVDLLVILFDDVDNIQTLPEILTTLKTTLSMDSINAKARILVGFAITGKSWIGITSSEAHHPLNRYFISRQELEPLNKQEVVQIIKMSLRESGVIFHQSIIENVFKFTKGHPFELQVLCYHLFKNQFRRTVNSDVWNKSLIEALNEMGQAIYMHWIDSLDNQEFELLRLISQYESKANIKDIIVSAMENSSDIVLDTITKNLSSMVEKGIITKQSDMYKISDHMFRAYFKQHIGDD